MNQTDDQTAIPNTVIITIDNNEHSLIREGKTYKLGPMIVRLLSFFRNNAKQLITRQQLMQQVWQSSYASDTAINRAISELRKALGGDRNDIIKTLSKKGYYFDIPENIIFVENEHDKDQKLKETKETAQLFFQHQTDDLIDNTNQTATATQSPHKNLIITLVIFSVLVILLSLLLLPLQNKPTSQYAQTSLYLYPIESVNNIKLNQTFNQALQNSITNEILKINQIVISNKPNTQSSTDAYRLKTLTSEVNNERNLSLQLINGKTQQIHYSTVLNIPYDNQYQSTQTVAAEIAAILRLYLFEPQLTKRYIDALKPLSHQDIEKLVTARKHIYTNIPNGLLYANNILTTLNTQYPNTAKILGLLSLIRAYDQPSDHPISQLKNQQLLYGNQALAIDPENHDANLALFYYHIDTAHLREQARKYANSLTRYHSGNSESWRAQLYLRITSVSPCSDIQQFVNNIPQDLFTPTRLMVIDTVLHNCQNQLPLTPLLDAISSQPNNRLNKAIYNNLYLFNWKNDKTSIVLNNKARVRTDNKLLTEIMQNYYLANNTISAQSAFETLTTQNSTYWRNIANLYRNFYTPHAQALSTELHTMPYDFLDSDTNLVLVSYLIRQLKSNQNSASKLQNYINKRPKFIVNLENRNETIALVMAYHANGQDQLSKSTAQRLFNQLEQYRTQQPSSFYFWSLGRYHLTSQLYCGEPCQTIPSDEYLATVFSSNHTWWLDDHAFMTQALAPWTNSPLAQTYLEQLKQDQIRLSQHMPM